MAGIKDIKKKGFGFVRKRRQKWRVCRLCDADGFPEVSVAEGAVGVAAGGDKPDVVVVDAGEG